MSPRLNPSLAAARVPRYTSYPTAPHFNGAVNGNVFADWIGMLPEHEPLSLYLHIPFCDSLCWFCGCHMRVVNTYTPVAAYTDLLIREIHLVGLALKTRRRATHVHFGGGSPTILRPTDIERLGEALRTQFDVAADAEFAIEVDPRGLSRETVDALAKAGVTRASIGVQDVNPRVQRAVNRIQPFEVTRDAIILLRDAGIGAINIDLMYGLPHQSVDDVRRTVDVSVGLNAQRFAAFGYAHVPEMKRHQALIDATALPGPGERQRQYEAMSEALSAAGYQPVGLDHFAKPDDALAIAQRNGTLRRNFQGYTTDDAPTLIGFGASAISALPQGYGQNVADVPDYRRAILAGQHACVRGRAVTAEDRVRRAIIERLMCDLRVNVGAVAQAHGYTASHFDGAFEALAPLRAEGLATVEGYTITIPPDARAGVRLVCAAFDAYLQPQSPARHAVAV